MSDDIGVVNKGAYRSVRSHCSDFFSSEYISTLEEGFSCPPAGVYFELFSCRRVAVMLMHSDLASQFLLFSNLLPPVLLHTHCLQTTGEVFAHMLALAAKVLLVTGMGVHLHQLRNTQISFTVPTTGP